MNDQTRTHRSNETPRDPARNSVAYLRERARIEEKLNHLRVVEQDDREENPTLAAWIEFGRHNWLWQMFHRKPR